MILAPLSASNIVINPTLVVSQHIQAVWTRFGLGGCTKGAWSQSLLHGSPSPGFGLILSWVKIILVVFGISLNGLLIMTQVINSEFVVVLLIVLMDQSQVLEGIHVAVLHNCGLPLFLWGHTTILRLPCCWRVRADKHDLLLCLQILRQGILIL